MNAHDAETLLCCHRGGKPPDARMQKALRWAEGEPDAKRKLAEQMEFDEQVVEAIHSINPPDDLKKKLGAVCARPRLEAAGIRKQIIDPAVLSALVGGVVILGIIAFLFYEKMERFTGRDSVEQMLAGTEKMSQVDFEPVTSTTDQLGDWLYMRGYDGYEVPPEIAALQVVGSRVYHLDGKPIAQLEVSRNDMPALVYEFHATDFGVQLPPSGAWKVITQNEWVAAIRQHQDHCFMIAFRGGESEMRDFLKSPPKK